jgi:2,4-dienoyl-CoA reductase-like NADH-dependent reductase (Old Yellow Enzyme family)
VDKVSTASGPDFPVAVKLNSADFQQGGFDFKDSLQVAQWLQEAGIDLLEISGGTYEQPRLLGVTGVEEEEPQPVRESTHAREAYFVDFALAMREKVSIPLMVTGGFRSRDAMQQALDGGAAVIGLGRPMCVITDAPARLLSGEAELPRYEEQLALFPPWLSFLNRFETLRTIGIFGIQYWYYAQLDALGRTGRANENISVFAATRQVMSHANRWLKARRS